MAKGFIRSAKSYAKNLGKLLWRVAANEQAPSKALSQLKRDTRKLRQSVERNDDSKGNRKEASRLVADGRLAYNGHHYSQAESYFRCAIEEDSSNAWAHTYLGHSLYKQGRRADAIAAWQHAIVCAPDSEAASKARKKIQNAEKSKIRNELEAQERMRDL